jgi:WD repeat-containing protein 48
MVPPGGTVTNGQTVSSNEQIPSDATAQSPLSERSDGQEKTTEDQKKGMFGSKKFRSLGFGMKSLKREKTNEAAIAKPAPVNETPSEDSDSRSSKTEDRTIEDNFLGVIQRMRHGYEEQLQHPHPHKDGEEPILRLDSGISPSLPNDTPVLKPPSNTTILIQEDRVDSGGVADLFEGSVGSLGYQADLIEKVAPTWLAECLLRNHIPPKDIVKVSFILEPLAGALPSIASDGYVIIQSIFPFPFSQ